MAPPPKKNQQPPPITPQALARLLKIKATTWSIYTDFKYGYRNKEDISTLPPNCLVVGSQNVLTNAADQVASRQGYALDGPAGTEIISIDSWYDFLAQSGQTQNLRKWGGNLEVRYYNPVNKTTSWINILSSLNPKNEVNFTSFFDATNELSKQCLFVNGNQNIYEWSGGVGAVAAVSNASGIISSIPSASVIGGVQFSSGGINYVVGDILTVSGGDGTATLEVTSVAPGGAGSVTLANGGGSGYMANDIISLQQVGTGLQILPQAYIKVLTVSGPGAILTYQLVSAGQAYFANQICSAVGGSGTGATFTINTTGNTATSWVLLTNGTGYSQANNVALTGGSGTGATLQILAVATGSITLQGSLNTSQLGFYGDVAVNQGKFQVLIDGNVYSYTASNANGGQALVGISPTPVGAGISVGDAVIQQPVVGMVSSANFIGTTWKFDLISTLNNQVFYGDYNLNYIYLSQTNNYQDVSQSTVRLQGEGASFPLDAPPVAFSPQGAQMYMSAGLDQWWVSDFVNTTLSVSGVNTATQLFAMERLKTTYNQAAQSQKVVGHFANSIMYMSNEPIFNTLGLVKNVYTDPQITNLSDPIKYDMDAYDYTDASVFYFNYYIYVAIPKNSIVRVFNVQKKYWEAPLTMSISGFYVADGTLHGHSYLTNESYAMFTGYNDNGNPINAIAAFAYDNMSNATHEALRPVLKNYNAFYVEGYITSNTQLTLTRNYDFGGFTSIQSSIINGQDKRIIFNKIGDGSLGKQSLGSYPIGSIFNVAANIPKFRKITTMLRSNYFEYQPVFSSNGIDQQWALLAFGPAQAMATELPTTITE